MIFYFPISKPDLILNITFFTGEHRDPFPKMDLDSGFVADKYPLCVDLPEEHFLKKGATYRLIGSSPQPDFHEYSCEWSEWSDYYWFEGPPEDGIFKLGSGSTLKSKLSSKNMLVTLDATIPCHGEECNVDSLIVVQIEEDPPIYYEYVRQPCVELSFYENAKKVKNWEKQMCANPKVDAAYDMCCPYPDDDWKYGNLLCLYDFEKTTQSSARSRCQSRFASGDLCDFTDYWGEDGCSTNSFLWWAVSYFTSYF